MKGEVVYLYAFDVASEIKTDKVGPCLAHGSATPAPLPFRLRVDRATPRSVPYYQPLTLELPVPAGLTLRGLPLKIQLRIYDVGALCVNVTVPFEAATLVELLPMHNAVLSDGRALDQLAEEQCTQVMTMIRAALVEPTKPTEPEAYTVFCLTELDGTRDVEHWLEEHRAEIAGLLTETDPARLSQQQITEVHRITRSFETTDHVIIDWDAALVVDLTGYVEDTLYVLELATVQLEEFHVIDGKLDHYLNRAYELFGKKRAPMPGATRRALRELRKIRVDATKLIEEVTHISKFFGDYFLARVFVGARNRFHLDHWRNSVQERLQQLDQLYSVVQAESNDRRMLVLEATIVVLFLVDIAALLIDKIP